MSVKWICTRCSTMHEHAYRDGAKVLFDDVVKEASSIPREPKIECLLVCEKCNVNVGVVIFPQEGDGAFVYYGDVYFVYDLDLAGGDENGEGASVEEAE